MEEKKIIWTKKAKVQLFSIMDYYAERNKSDSYSLKLDREIKRKLNLLDFSIALPQKTSVPNLFYFTYNHISVFFTNVNSLVTIKIIMDERRNPKSIQLLLNKTD